MSGAIEVPRVSAVTGTNGKTSVATATLQLMRAAGWSAAGVDSLGITDVDGRREPARFRKSPDYLPGVIDAQVALGARAVSLEAFVGILKDGLLERVDVDVAVFTGLERDHLDTLGSIEAYWAAKLRLVEDHLRPKGTVVLAVDSARGDLVREAARRRGARLVTVGEGGDVELVGAQERDGMLHGTLRMGVGADGGREIGEVGEVRLPTVHRVAATNLLLAATAVVALGGDAGAVAAGLAQVVPPPGRLEVVGEAGGVRAVVDTAHNPGALRTALTAVRERAEGRLLLVVGAGGERDRPKRAQMGEIAAELADLVVLTDDNPRRELPARIRAEVRAGCPDCIEIPRRADAIRAALAMARPGDTVLVAGKGDETEQVVGTRRIPHDDRAVLRAAMGLGDDERRPPEGGRRGSRGESAQQPPSGS